MVDDDIKIYDDEKDIPKTGEVPMNTEPGQVNRQKNGQYDQG